MCVVFCCLSWKMETRKASLIEILWGLTKIRFNTHRAYWVYTILMKFSCLLQRCRITVLLVGCTLSLLDLSSPARDWTQAGYSQWGHRVRYNLVTEHRHIAAKAPSPKHRTAREFPRMVVFNHSSFDQVVQVYPDFIYFDNKLVCKYPLLLLCTTCEIYEGICTLVSICLDMKLAWMTNTSLLLMCKNVKSESEVAQSCPTLCNPMDCSLPGSSVHGISQVIILEWVVISFFRGSSWPRNLHWQTDSLPLSHLGYCSSVLSWENQVKTCSF